MKRKFTKIISCFFAILMLVPNTIVYAADEKTDVQILQENIFAIEEELTANGTDVFSEISEMIVEYNEMLNNTTVNEEKQQITDLVSTLEEILSEYISYNEKGNINERFHIIYTLTDDCRMRCRFLLPFSCHTNG